MMTTHRSHQLFPLDAGLTRCLLIAVGASSKPKSGIKINRCALIDHLVQQSGISEAQADALISGVHLAGMLTLSSDDDIVGLGEAGRAWLRSRGAH